MMRANFILSSNLIKQPILANFAHEREIARVA